MSAKEPLDLALSSTIDHASIWRMQTRFFDSERTMSHAQIGIRRVLVGMVVIIGIPFDDAPARPIGSPK